MSQQRHTQVVNTLVKDIYTRKLKPGTKLPSERQLSTQMNVDRTSLRVALKQLEAMHVLDIRHGDGIYVNDYIELAGLEFIEILFLNDEALSNNEIIDEFMVDELFEFWAEFFPVMMKIAIPKASMRDAKALLDMINEALDNINDRQKIAEINFKSQELIAEIANNILFSLITNSLRPVRKKLLEVYTATMEKEDLKKELINRRELIIKGFTEQNEAFNVDSLTDEYRDNLSLARKQSRKHVHDSLSESKNPKNNFFGEKPE